VGVRQGDPVADHCHHEGIEQAIQQAGLADLVALELLAEDLD